MDDLTNEQLLELYLLSRTRFGVQDDYVFDVKEEILAKMEDVSE